MSEMGGWSGAAGPDGPPSSEQPSSPLARSRRHRSTSGEGVPHRPPRIVLAKPGLDGHDRGVKVIAMALRDAGAEVIFLGLRQPPARIVAAAVQESADVIGVSVLSGAHVVLSRQLVEERSRAGIEDVPIVVGGTIPRADVSKLTEIGISAVFGVGSPLHEAVEGIIRQASSPRPSR